MSCDHNCHRCLVKNTELGALSSSLERDPVLLKEKLKLLDVRGRIGETKDWFESSQSLHPDQV